MKENNTLRITKEDGVWLVTLNDKPCFPRFDILAVYLQAVIALFLFQA